MRIDTPGPIVRAATARQWLLVITVGLSAALLIGSSWWWLASPQTPQQTSAALCDTYLSFVRSMRGTGPDSQAQRRYQTTKLMSLARQTESTPQHNAEPVRQGYYRLQAVLNLPSANYRDAFINARPIAVYCGFDPRTGQVAGYLP